MIFNTSWNYQNIGFKCSSPIPSYVFLNKSLTVFYCLLSKALLQNQKTFNSENVHGIDVGLIGIHLEGTAPSLLLILRSG